MNRRQFLSSLQKESHHLDKTEVRDTLGAAPSLEPYSGVWDRRAMYHLLRRTVVAPTYAEVEEASTKSMEDLVTQLTVPSAILPGPRGWFGDTINASGFPWYDNRFDLVAEFYVEMRRWWYERMTNGGLSVQERMTLFWHNHFASNGMVFPDPRLLYLQNQLFRKDALGSFRRLVRDVTLDKAMLLFLDGKHNKAGTVNENYARELQELFTIGIADNDGDPNYSQQDIVEAARSLTGWDWIGFGTDGAVASNFITGHDSSSKSLYGQAIPGNIEGGPELERLLDIIFSREETSRYVVRKLYRFFVHTDVTLTPVYPIPAEIEEHIIAPLAAEFRSSDWNVAVVLRRLLMSEHFYEPDIIASSIKSPVDFFVGTLRATRVGPLVGNKGDFLYDVAQDRAKILGQNLFFPPGVQGWQFYRSWISTSTLPQRHSYTDAMINGVNVTLTTRANALFPDIKGYDTGVARIDLLAFAKQFPSFNDPTQLIADIAAHLLAYPPSDRLLKRLKSELVGDRDYEWEGADDDAKTLRLQAMLRYLMRSSNYQLM